jgi:hypothetical protein
MRSFANVDFFAYDGIPNIAPIKLRNQSGQSIPLIVSWSDYSTALPNIGINVSFAGAIQTPLQNIRSVYIDNMGSSCPVYVMFPDTGYIVVAKENSAGWFPVYTNQFTLQIIALGIDPNAIPTTKVLVTNLAIEASTDVEIESAISQFLASPLLQRSGAFNPSIGVPALGDQFQGVFLAPQIDNNIINLFGTPLSSGQFVYVTCAYAIVTNSGSGSSFRIFLESTGISGIFLEQDVQCPPGSTLLNAPLLQMTGQWKLDASQTYRLRTKILTGAPNGALNFNFSYTVNP